MPESELLSIIREKAAKERADIEDEARVKAESILNEARDTANAMLDEVRGRVNAEADRLRERRYNAVRFRINASRYELKASAIEDIWRETRRALNGIIGSERYPAVLDALFQERIVDVPDTTTVMANPADAGMVKSLIARSGRDVRFESDESVTGGVEFHWPDGSVVVRNTLFHRLERLKAEGNAEIASMLFGDAEDGKA